MSDPKLCFMNACDKKYAGFISPFVYFSSLYNTNSVYEFLLTEDLSIDEIHKIMKVSEICGVDVKLRRIEDDIPPVKARWLYEPFFQKDYEYAYIGDVDILILEPIADFHLKKMNETNECYDNIVRFTDKSRMSGLHFCRKDYFEKTENARNIMKELELAKKSKVMDEVMLFHIIKSSNLKIRFSENANDFTTNRPAHGLHISLNRAPFKEGTLNFSFNKKYGKRFLEDINKEKYIEASKNFTPFFNDVISKIIPLVQKDF